MLLRICNFNLSVAIESAPSTLRPFARFSFLGAPGLAAEGAAQGERGSQAPRGKKGHDFTALYREYSLPANYRPTLLAKIRR